MRRAFTLFLVAGLTGCGWIHGTKPEPDNGGNTSMEVRSNGSPPAKMVYVKYDGPERLTRRFAKFFEIAADDYGIKIAGNSRDADAQMEVRVTEEATHVELKGKVLHAGFILIGDRSATVDYCEHLGWENDNDGISDESPVDYSRTYAQGLVAELKKSQPTVIKTFVDPIKNSLDPYFVELVRKELVKADYVPVSKAADADAVLRTLGTTLEPIGAKGVKRRLRVKISGSANFSEEGNSTFYKSIDEPVLPKSKICLSQTKFYLSHGYPSDNFWSNAASAARALAKQ